MHWEHHIEVHESGQWPEQLSSLVGPLNNEPANHHVVTRLNKGANVMLPSCAGGPGAQYIPPVLVICQRQITSTPNDHFIIGPNCRVSGPGIGAFVEAGATNYS